MDIDIHIKYFSDDSAEIFSTLSHTAIVLKNRNQKTFLQPTPGETNQVITISVHPDRNLEVHTTGLRKKIRVRVDFMQQDQDVPRRTSIFVVWEDQEIFENGLKLSDPLKN